MAKVLEVRSDWLYQKFIKIGYVMTSLWCYSYVVFIFCEGIEFCGKGKQLYCAILWRKRQRSCRKFLILINAINVEVFSFSINAIYMEEFSFSEHFMCYLIHKMLYHVTRSIQRTQTHPRMWPLTLSCDLDLKSRSKRLISLDFAYQIVPCTLVSGMMSMGYLFYEIYITLSFFFFFTWPLTSPVNFSFCQGHLNFCH